MSKSNASVTFLSEDPMTARFTAWKAKHGKSYGASQEEEKF
jgi:hypothetical protein